MDGTIRELGDVSYLLSPQDLMGVDYLPQLVDAGVGCFKIEVRGCVPFMCLSSLCA